jgi:hypothetical protein
MVQNVINLDERESRVINIVKTKYGLKDISQALSMIIKHYEECELEPQLRPEFVEDIEDCKALKSKKKLLRSLKSTLKFWKSHRDLDLILMCPRFFNCPILCYR